MYPLAILNPSGNEVPCLQNMKKGKFMIMRMTFSSNLVIPMYWPRKRVSGTF